MTSIKDIQKAFPSIGSLPNDVTDKPFGLRSRTPITSQWHVDIYIHKSQMPIERALQAMSAAAETTGDTLRFFPVDPYDAIPVCKQFYDSIGHDIEAPGHGDRLAAKLDRQAMDMRYIYIIITQRILFTEG